MLTTRSTLTNKATTKLFGIVLVSLSLACVTFGQIKSGVITGMVTDSNGAVIPGASVSITNQETNVVSNTVTNDTGGFTVPYLSPGTYTLDVDKPGSGFAKYTQLN